jgi:hypothetical protein
MSPLQTVAGVEGPGRSGSHRPVKLKYGIALIALIWFSQALPTGALAVTVEVARKCSALTDKAFPLRLPGNPAAGRTHGMGQDLREYFNKCVANGGNMEEQAPVQGNQSTQQPDTIKLKAYAQNVVSIIRGDKTKTQAYCRIHSLSDEMDRAEQTMDEQKGDVLTKKINDLEKQIGPEYLALFDALGNASQNSTDFQDILSPFHALDESCPH